MASDLIHSGAYQSMRTTLKAGWKRVNAACYFCGQATIDWDGEKHEPDSFELQHIISRKDAKRMGRPDLIIDPTNAAPAHCRCNRSAGARAPRPSIGETTEEF